MRKHFFFLAVALILLAFTLPDVSAKGRHCFTLNFQGASMDFNFSGPFQAIPGSGGITRFAVPEGTDFIIDNIQRYTYACADGGDVGAALPVRVIEIFPNGEELETAHNYSSSGYNPACEGGLALFGDTSFKAYTFSASGVYNFRVEYSTNASGTSWRPYRNIQVLVGPGSIKVLPAQGTTIGLKNSIYERENSKDSDFYWEIRNTGNIDVNLLNVEASPCGTSLLGQCSFPNFTPGSRIVKAKESYILKERVNVQLPQNSPENEILGVNVRFKDIYGLAEIDTNSQLIAIDQNVSFNVVAAAYAPYAKEGHFTITQSNANYFVQVCTDSAANAYHSEPLFGMEVYDDVGNQVAAANFHSITNCSNPIAVERLINQGKELYDEFSVSPDKIGKTYTWKLEGLVGTNADTAFGAATYKSDYARIGIVGQDDPARPPGPNRPVNPNNPAPPRLGNFVVRERLGPQIIVHSPDAPIQSFIVNAFERTKRLGLFTPEIAEQNHSPTAYYLTNLTIGYDVDEHNAVVFNAGAPTRRAFDGNTEVFITPNRNVFAKTKAIRRLPTDAPFTDLNVVWIDKEKFMLEFDTGAVGLCRDLDGKAIGNTGESAKPHVKYEWRPKLISEDECDTANPGYSVCDSTQFSVVLIRKLNRISSLASQGKRDLAAQETRFSAYIMKDGFSPDFRSDFDYYMKNIFFAGDDLNYVSKWSKYFTDPNRMYFDNLSNPSDLAILPEPGLYEVAIEFEFDPGAKPFQLFDVQGRPNSKMTIYFTKDKGVSLPANLLYSLPIDGTLGTNPGITGSHRVGYGIGFRGAIVDVSVDSSSPGSLVQTTPMAQGSAPLAVVDVNKYGTFFGTHKERAGQLLFISDNGDGTYSMKFSPSNPLPAIIKAQGNGKTISAAYSIIDSQAPLNAGPFLTRLVEIGYGTGNAVLCKDTSSPGPQVLLPAFAGTDRQRSSYSSAVACSLVSAVSAENVYTFEKETAASSNAYLETIFYTPYGRVVSIRNACASQGVFYIARLDSDAELAGLKELRGNQPSFEFDSPTKGVATIADALATIPQGKGCLLGASQKTGNIIKPVNVGVWWNEEKLIKDFRQSNAVKAAIPNISACTG